MLVKIKAWDEMAVEFGFNEEGDIACKGTFVINMEEQISEDRIIEVIKYPADFGESFCYIWEGDLSEWEITDDMISEYIKDEK